MELIQLSDKIYYTYLYVGHNKTSNPIYSISIFEDFGERIVNITIEKALRKQLKLDKLGGIRRTCEKIEIKNIVKWLMEV